MCQDTATARVRVDVASLRLICCALLCLLLPALASAQTMTTANRPVTFGWEHSEAADASHGAPTHYRFLIDGVEVGDAIPVGTRTYQHPGVSPGNHTAVVYAVNAFGQAASGELQFVAGLPPAAPSTPSIVEVTARFEVTPQPDGSVVVNTLHVGAVVSR